MRLLNKATYLVTFFIVVFFAGACSEVEPGRSGDMDCLDVRFAAGKVFADGNWTYWNKGDLVSVFLHSGTNECWYFDGEDGSRSGQLRISGARASSRDRDNIIAVYPYSELNSLNGPVASIELPSVQKFHGPGSFGEGSALLAACSRNSELEFRYLSGFASLRFDGSCSVKKITLRSRGDERVSGLCNADFSATEPTLYGAKSATVELKGPYEIAAGDEVLFSLVPQNYDSGLEWYIQYSNGYSQTVYCASVCIRPGTVAEPVRVKPSANLVLSLTFCTGDGSEGNCPFTSTPGRADVGSLSKAYYLISDKNLSYPFKFHVQNWTGENLRFTGAGLNIGGTEGDYMLLPGIPGKRLSRIIMTGRYAFEYRVGDFGPFRLPAESRSEAVLPDSEPGKSYALYFGLSTLGDGVCKIYNLELTYEDA